MKFKFHLILPLISLNLTSKSETEHSDVVYYSDNEPNCGIPHGLGIMVICFVCLITVFCLFFNLSMFILIYLIFCKQIKLYKKL
jgi:hypothetical protein